MFSKICTQCNKRKPLSEFRKNGKGLMSKCKPCQYEYTKAHNKVNAKRYQKYYRKAAKKAYQRGQEFFNRHKGLVGCQKCGEKRYWVLDYHHTDPNTKDRPITYYKSLSMSKLKDEIRNCIVLCANCHRDLHYHLDN